MHSGTSIGFGGVSFIKVYNQQPIVPLIRFHGANAGELKRPASSI
jgi:hypothetical protein